jgi:hypothetical protein
LAEKFKQFRIFTFKKIPYNKIKSKTFKLFIFTSDNKMMMMTMTFILLFFLPYLIHSHHFAICIGEFALCAASLCYPTGQLIQINNLTYPEMTCLCPIYTGRAIADLSGGNMNGSCVVPQRNSIWSLYAPVNHIPQEMNDWNCTKDMSVAPILYCAVNTTQALASDTNCFSFLCKRTNPIRGIAMANCSCPLFEDINGERSIGKRFFTQAGQKNSKFCLSNPVGLQTMLLEANRKQSEIFPLWQKLNNATLVSKTCRLRQDKMVSSEIQ